MSAHFLQRTLKVILCPRMHTFVLLLSCHLKDTVNINGNPYPCSKFTSTAETSSILLSTKDHAPYISFVRRYVSFSVRIFESKLLYRRKNKNIFHRMQDKILSTEH